MSSYVYMKILESRPRRYDWGISLLSLGAADKVKKRLVDDNVRPGSRVFEIGCGTGSMAILAAQKGASVVGYDISAPMLQVAREKVEAAGVTDRVELVEQGISSMDKLSENSFDVVMATLVFSELSPDEQAYAISQAYRILKRGGKLAIADEARPRTPMRRLLHSAVRIPLLLVTFVLTQTTTRAVTGLAGLVSRAGFTLDLETRSHLDSFVYLVAIKEEAR